MSILYKKLQSEQSSDKITVEQTDFPLEFPIKHYKMTPCTMRPTYTEIGEQIVNMKVRSDDVWIVTYPKAGTHWVKEIAWMMVNNLNYKKCQEIPIGKRSPWLENISTRDLTQHPLNEINSIDVIDKLPSPRIIHTHLPAGLLPRELWTVNPKIIYVLRNIKDSIVSLCHFWNNWYDHNLTLEQFTEQFLNDLITFSPYSQHVLDYWEISKIKTNILILRYEDLKNNFLQELIKINKFFNKSYNVEQLKELAQFLDFETMRKNIRNDDLTLPQKYKRTKTMENFCFFRKGQIGTYKEEMSPAMIQQYDDYIKLHFKNTDINYYKM